ncbi:hypothetical protein Z043_110924, partial [Scleropages formosus]
MPKLPETSENGGEQKNESSELHLAATLETSSPAALGRPGPSGREPASLGNWLQDLSFADRRAKSFSRSWSDPTPVKPESLHDSRD